MKQQLLLYGKGCVTKLRILRNKKNENFETCWVLGGSEIYNCFIEKRLWDRIYLTKILAEFECDRFFPDFGSCKEIWDEENVSKEIQKENMESNFLIISRYEKQR